MTRAKLAQIRAKQLPDPVKRRRADYVIPSGQDRGAGGGRRSGGSCRHAARLPPRGLARALAAPFAEWGCRMQREIVLDTETTGLDPDQGHRLVEVAAVELVNHLPTGRHLPQLPQPRARHARGGVPRPRPERRVPARLSRSSPRWSTPFLEFLGDSRLVIHNAAFDLRFLNAELARHGREPFPHGRAIDTLFLAQRRFPGRAQQPGRAVPPLRGRQLGAHAARRAPRLRAPGRGLPAPDRRPADRAGPGPARASARPARRSAAPVRPPRPHAPSAEELAAHAAFVAKLDDPVWLR